MRTRQHETTEMLEQKKTNSKTPVGPTKDRASTKAVYQISKAWASGFKEEDFKKFSL